MDRFEKIMFFGLVLCCVGVIWMTGRALVEFNQLDLVAIIKTLPGGK